VTVTVTWQLPPIGMLPPERETDAPPPVAEAVPPTHVVEALGVPALVTPPG